MTGMIERVARAIEPETFRRQDIAIQFLKSAGREWEGSPEQATHLIKIERAFARARAAIAAMMEPTEQMSDAMRLANMNIAGGYGGPSGWEAAIQTALKDENPC